MPTFYLPSYLGIIAGYIFRFSAFIFNKRFNISSIRIKKFLSKSVIETKAFNKGFKPPIKLEKAIDYTINEEFLKNEIPGYRRIGFYWLKFIKTARTKISLIKSI